MVSSMGSHCVYVWGMISYCLLSRSIFIDVNNVYGKQLFPNKEISFFFAIHKRFVPLISSFHALLFLFGCVCACIICHGISWSNNTNMYRNTNFNSRTTAPRHLGRYFCNNMTHTIPYCTGVCVYSDNFLCQKTCLITKEHWIDFIMPIGNQSRWTFHIAWQKS